MAAAYPCHELRTWDAHSGPEERSTGNGGALINMVSGIGTVSEDLVSASPSNLSLALMKSLLPLQDQPG